MTPKEIDEEIERLKRLKEATPAKRGRPPLTEEEMVERQMMRLRAKKEAKRRFAEEESQNKLIANKLPTSAGVWKRVHDGAMIAISLCHPDARYFQVVDMQLTSVSGYVKELLGNWEKFSELCELKNVPRSSSPQQSRALKEADEHLVLTKRWRERMRELQAVEKKPCANYRCEAVLEYVDPRQFCDACESALDESGQSS